MWPLPYMVALIFLTLAAALPASTTTPSTAMVTTPAAMLVPTQAVHVLAQQQQQQQPPPYDPVVTAAPGQDAALASLGYYQTTYYACNTIGGSEHCGWHVPILEVSGAAERGCGSWRVVVVVMVVAGGLICTGW